MGVGQPDSVTLAFRFKAVFLVTPRISDLTAVGAFRAFALVHIFFTDFADFRAIIWRTGTSGWV